MAADVITSPVYARLTVLLCQATRMGKSFSLLANIMTLHGSASQWRDPVNSQAKPSKSAKAAAKLWKLENILLVLSLSLGIWSPSKPNKMSMVKCRFVLLKETFSLCLSQVCLCHVQKGSEQPADHPLDMSAYGNGVGVPCNACHHMLQGLESISKSSDSDFWIATCTECEFGMNPSADITQGSSACTSGISIARRMNPDAGSSGFAYAPAKHIPVVSDISMAAVAFS